jgi:hypothetical protein
MGDHPCPLCSIGVTAYQFPLLVQLSRTDGLRCLSPLDSSLRRRLQPCPSHMLVGVDNRAVDVVDVAIELAVDIGLVLDRGKESLPESRFARAVKAARHRAPGPIPLRETAPGRPGTDESQDTIEDAAVVSSWKSCCGLRSREARLQLLQVSTGGFMSVHTQQYMALNRACELTL